MYILIDTGSTHNFLDLQLAKNLQCILTPMADQVVTVADDSYMICSKMVKYFT